MPYHHIPTPVSPGRLVAAALTIVVIALLGGTALAFQGTYLSTETAHLFAARSLGILMTVFVAVCWVLRQMGVRG